MPTLAFEAQQSQLLLDHVESFAIPATLPWAETLALTVHLSSGDENTSTAEQLAADDLQRETAFYNASVTGVKEGLAKLATAAIPTKRPSDFYAEMIKSDEHMAKIKRKLLHEKQAVQMVDDKKRKELERKLSKQKKATHQQKQSLHKKVTIEAIDEWKKEKVVGAGATAQGDKALESAFSEALKRRKESGKRKAESKGKQSITKRPSFKRQRKNEKYGDGPRKDRKNTRESTNDMSDFNTRRGAKKAAGKTPTIKKRAGKARRQQIRSKLG